MIRVIPFFFERLKRSVNATARRISRDEGGLDLDKLERRTREVVEE